MSRWRRYLSIARQLPAGTLDIRHGARMASQWLVRKNAHFARLGTVEQVIVLKPNQGSDETVHSGGHLRLQDSVEVRRREGFSLDMYGGPVQWLSMVDGRLNKGRGKVGAESEDGRSKTWPASASESSELDEIRCHGHLVMQGCRSMRSRADSPRIFSRPPKPAPSHRSVVVAPRPNAL